MVHGTKFAVDDFAGAHDLAAEDLTDGLVTKADTEERRVGFGRRFGEGKADACLVGIARAGGEDDGFGFQAHGLLNIQRIVAVNLAFGAKLAQKMNEVEGETVVIVDQK